MKTKYIKIIHFYALVNTTLYNKNEKIFAIFNINLEKKHKYNKIIINLFDLSNTRI